MILSLLMGITIGILKALKVKSLQYLYNISKKVRDGDHLLHAKHFWVCSARASQSTHNCSVWLRSIQQKVAILNWEKCWFPGQALIKELIFSQKRLWIRKGKHYMHVMLKCYLMLLISKWLLFKNRWIWFVGKYVIPNSERKNSKLALSL